MAVTALQLAAAIRVGDGETALIEPELSIITRLLGVGQALVELYAPDAPEAIKDEATIRVAGYLYDQPNAGSADRYISAWRNSGGYALVAAWVSRRAEVVGTDGVDGNTGGQDAPTIIFPKWHLVGTKVAPFVAGTEYTMDLESFPVGPWTTYADLIAAMVDGSITQIALRILQNDPGDTDSDYGVFVVPNIDAFGGPSTFSVFPAWALNVNPTKLNILFNSTFLSMVMDTAVPASPFARVRVAVYG